MSNQEAQLCEIFTSFQGEGIYVGEKQIFIRFSGCNLNCQYCDSQEALALSKTYKLHQAGEKSSFHALNNPIQIDELLNHIKDFDKPKGTIHSICITGGEPLLQVDFLKNALPQIKKCGYKVYLETNGTLPSYLEEIIEMIDIVALDIKLASSTGLSAYLKEHRKSIEIASLVDLFIKIIITKNTKIVEFEEAIKMVASIDNKIPTVLQPVTPTKEIKHRPTLDQINAFHNIAKKYLDVVRVIPQMHRVLGIN